MNVKKILSLVGVVILSGCSAEETVISPLFGVCARLPTDSIYVLDRRPPVDFDEGMLKVAEKELTVYIGHNPDFPKNNRLGVPTDGAFLYVGKEQKHGVGKLLFAQRGPRNEILYVMFSGNSLQTESQLLEGVSLSSCTN